MKKIEKKISLNFKIEGKNSQKCSLIFQLPEIENFPKKFLSRKN